MVKGLLCAGCDWLESAVFPCIDFRKFATAAAASVGGRAALRTRESARVHLRVYEACMGNVDVAVGVASCIEP